MFYSFCTFATVSASLTESRKKLSILFMCLLTGCASQVPNQSLISAFRLKNNCPVTSSDRGKCPGYVIGYHRPICAGGEASIENMQWQDLEYAKEKVKIDLELCKYH